MAIAYPLIWPGCLLRPRDILLTLQSPSRGGGPGYTGVEAIVSSPASRWSIKLSNILIRTAAQILTWRALEGQLSGRAGTIAVPIYDRARAPTNTVARTRVPFLDGSTFSDGSEFVNLDSSITLRADAPLNATEIALRWSATAPQPGQHFTLDGHLYRIVSMLIGGGATGKATIRPWLRAPAFVGAALNFDDPTCICRLATDDAMSLDLELWRFSSPTVEFTESF